MRHNKAGRRLGRTTSHRVAMFRNMVTSLFASERITTTDSKAKEIRPIAEKMITLGKKGDLHSRRLAAAYIRDKKIVAKLFDTIAPRFKERQGGYTRIIKVGTRLGDTAPLSIIELVEEHFQAKEKLSVKKSTSVAKQQAVVNTVESVAVLPVLATISPEDAEQAASENANITPDESVEGKDVIVVAENVPLSEVKEGEEECEAAKD